MLTARLRDARFFWDADRKATLESRVERLGTILFHKKLGSYREKAERVAALAAWIAGEAFGRPDAADAAERAGRLCKADLATDMVRELTELQGTMGGIYAREEGLPEAVWKAIYYHYLPVGVEADAPPSRAQLGAGGVAWAAVSLADKLDSVVGHVRGGRAADRVARSARPAAAGAGRGEDPGGPAGADGTRRPRRRSAVCSTRAGGAVRRLRRGRGRRCMAFMADRLAYLLEQRGFDVRSVRAVMHGDAGTVSPLEARRKLEALAQMAGSRGPARRGGPLQAREEHLEGRRRRPADCAAVGARCSPSRRRWRCATRWMARTPASAPPPARGDYRRGLCRDGDAGAGGGEVLRRRDGDGRGPAAARGAAAAGGGFARR